MKGQTRLLRESYRWFIRANMKNYEGLWIAIHGKRVVAKGKNLEEVMRMANKKYPNSETVLTKIPEKNETLVL